jgi:hypothetical protein
VLLARLNAKGETTMHIDLVGLSKQISDFVAANPALAAWATAEIIALLPVKSNSILTLFYNLIGKILEAQKNKTI